MRKENRNKGNKKEKKRNKCVTNKTKINKEVIATRYGLEVPEIESRWGRDFPHPSRLALGPNQPPILMIGSLTWGVKRPGRGVAHPPNLATRLKKGNSYTSTTPLGLRCLFWVDHYLYL
jgi:hypothetical protein